MSENALPGPIPAHARSVPHTPAAVSAGIREAASQKPVELAAANRSSAASVFECLAVHDPAAAPDRPIPDSPERIARRSLGRTVSAEEIERLRRLVNLATTAVAEMNLWLANLGNDPLEVKP